MIRFFLLFLLSGLALADYKNESEFSNLTTGGNSRVQTYLVKTLNQFESGKRLIKFGGHYTYGEAGDAVSARDWDVNGKYEQLLTENIAWTLGELVEGYEFQGIKARFNSDTGIKYYFVKNDVRNFFSEIGFRYTVEERFPPGINQFEHKGRLATEFNEKVSTTFQYRLWAEYIPNFTNSDDYLFNFEASGTAIMSSIFSLKVAYKGLYDDVPTIRGNKNFDYTYTTSLVAKF